MAEINYAKCPPRDVWRHHGRLMKIKRRAFQNASCTYNHMEKN